MEDLQKCARLALPFAELLSGDNESSAPNRLLQLQLPQAEAKWIIANTDADFNAGKKQLVRDDVEVSWLELSYLVARADGKTAQSHGKDELLDFQSVVVLGKSTTRSGEAASRIEEWNLQFAWAQRLHTALDKLNQAGHFFYGSFRVIVPLSEPYAVLHDMAIEREVELGRWETVCLQARHRHHYLNYYSMRQLRALVTLIETGGQTEANESDSVASELRAMALRVNPSYGETVDVDDWTVVLLKAFMASWASAATHGLAVDGVWSASDLLTRLGTALDAAFGAINLERRYRAVAMTDVEQAALGTLHLALKKHLGHDTAKEGATEVIEEPGKAKPKTGKGVVLFAVCGGGDGDFKGGGGGVTSGLDDFISTTVVDAVMTAYACAGALPEWSDLLYCCHDTPWEAVEAFLLRWAQDTPLNAAANGNGDGNGHADHAAPLSALSATVAPPSTGSDIRLFCLGGIEDLSLALQHRAANMLRDLTPHAKGPLVLVQGALGPRSQVGQLASRYSHARIQLPKLPPVVTAAMATALTKSRSDGGHGAGGGVFTSRAAGAGKSFEVRRMARALDAWAYRRVRMNRGDMDEKEIVGRLTATCSTQRNVGRGPLFVHLDVADTVTTAMDRLVLSITALGGIVDFTSGRQFLFAPSSTALGVELPASSNKKASDQLRSPMYLPVTRVVAGPKNFCSKKKELIEVCIFTNSINNTTFRQAL